MFARERVEALSDDKPSIKLRPMLPADVPVLAAVYQASIEEIGAEDYDETQCAAWAAAADDEVAFGAKLSAASTLVATIGGAPVGFASFSAGGSAEGAVSMVYVYPAAARHGVASSLLDAVEKLAGSRGCGTLIVDASDCSRPFFEGRGYEALQRQTAMMGDVWFGNTRMRKRLG